MRPAIIKHFMSGRLMMKICFSHEISISTLVDYIVDRGWDDCLISSDESSLVYETASGSARLTLTATEGEYEGQRSLLFSHAVFAWVTRGWLDDSVEFTSTESSDSERHPMKYMGRCFMVGLRSDVTKRFLNIEEGDEIFFALEDAWKRLDNLLEEEKEEEREIRDEITLLYRALEDPSSKGSKGFRDYWSRRKEAIHFQQWKWENRNAPREGRVGFSDILAQAMGR
jgi:hypothetical protein